jgi:hypothetical protein
MLLYAVGQKYLVDATAEVAGHEKVWHSINHSILSGLTLLYAVRSTWWMPPLRWWGARKSGTLINHSILSGLMLLQYAVGQKYLVDATAEVADLIPEVEKIILETRRKPIFGEDITQHVKNHKVQVSVGQVTSRV